MNNERIQYRISSLIKLTTIAAFLCWLVITFPPPSPEPEDISSEFRVFRTVVCICLGIFWIWFCVLKENTECIVTSNKEGGE